MPFRRLGKLSQKSERGHEAFPEVWVGSGGAPEGSGGVVSPSRGSKGSGGLPGGPSGVRRPFQRFRMGRKVLPEVQKALPEVQEVLPEV